jgi:hypothetical protein
MRYRKCCYRHGRCPDEVSTGGPMLQLTRRTIGLALIGVWLLADIARAF